MTCPILQHVRDTPYSSFSDTSKLVFVVRVVGAELRPTTGLLFILHLIYEHGERWWNDLDTGKLKISEKRMSRSHFVHRKISHGLTRAQTRASVVGDRRLTAVDMVRHTAKLTLLLALHQPHQTQFLGGLQGACSAMHITLHRSSVCQLTLGRRVNE
jgi:hypothetical protein